MPFAADGEQMPPKRPLVVAVLLLASAVTAGAAPKTDVIELVNGDRITCEIRILERGKLTVKTDGLGTISIEWDDIDRLTSNASYDIELASGERRFGSLARSADAKTADIVSSTGVEKIALDRIIRLSPVGRTFWRRLEGSLDGGFSFTQANVQTQWTFHTDVRYRSPTWLSELIGESALTTSEDVDRQSRNSLGLRTRRYVRPLWSLVGLAQLQQNEELSLNLRTVLGGGIGRMLAQSNRFTTGVIAGVSYTQEQYADAEDLSMAEAIGAISVQWFTFDRRATNLGIEAASFYALNGSSRTRLELSTTFKNDIVGDLYWSINGFESYSSQPPPEQKSNDFGVSAAVGWSF